MKEYIKQIRLKLGSRKFIHPAARIIIENNIGEFLFVERLDNGNLGLPAGSFEEGETIEECIKREVEEETGLTLVNLTVIGISSNPKNETVKYPNGDEIQYFTVEFYSNDWIGELNVKDKNEIKCAKFMEMNNKSKLPINELSIFDSLYYYRINNKIMLK